MPFDVFFLFVVVIVLVLRGEHAQSDLLGLADGLQFDGKRMWSRGLGLAHERLQVDLMRFGFVVAVAGDERELEEELLRRPVASSLEISRRFVRRVKGDLPGLLLRIGFECTVEGFGGFLRTHFRRASRVARGDLRTTTARSRGENDLSAVSDA